MVIFVNRKLIKKQGKFVAIERFNIYEIKVR